MKIPDVQNWDNWIEFLIYVEPLEYQVTVHNVFSRIYTMEKIHIPHYRFGGDTSSKSPLGRQCIVGFRLLIDAIDKSKIIEKIKIELESLEIKHFQVEPQIDDKRKWGISFLWRECYTNFDEKECIMLHEVSRLANKAFELERSNLSHRSTWTHMLSNNFWMKDLGYLDGIDNRLEPYSIKELVCLQPPIRKESQ